MNSWIIYNGSYYHIPMMDQVFAFKHAIESRDINCELVLNEHLLLCMNTSIEEAGYSKPDFVLFWSKDVILAQWLEMQNIPVFNNSEGIRLSDNKLLTHLALQKAGIPFPKTISFPMLYPGYTPSIEETDKILDKVESCLAYPIVIKEAFGSFGIQVFKVSNRQELLQKYMELRHKPALFQEYIHSSSGVDTRVQVVGDTAIAAMRRRNNHDFRSNITTGGITESCELTRPFINMAVQATKALGLSFAGIDLLTGINGEPIVCEVNSNAFVKNISKISGLPVAQIIIDDICQIIRKS